tara:strand:- start:25901 stop:27145 length:1245 start_codon:yes stop_codon:yes gene_type:complete
MKPTYKKHKGFDPLGPCGKGRCPICTRNNAFLNLKNTVTSENFTSDSNSVFVGHYNYPNVNVGILAPPEIKQDSWLNDAPNYWAQQNYQIPQIVNLRSSLLNNKQQSNVLNARKKEKIIELGQELAMASSPAALEVNLKQKPKFRLQTSDYSLPMGPSTALKKIKLTENTKIPRKIDYIVSDSDLKTSEAIKILYKDKFNENTLTKLFSIGNLGLKKNRVLVPTRWSITGVDSNIGKFLTNQVKYNPYSGYLAYFGSYLGNYFLVLMFPDAWQYELFETYVPHYTNFNSNLKYTTDYEPYEGRKKYVEQTAGGFYASKLAVLEQLTKIKKQASVLVLRFITDEYTMPLGVFVVREAVRKTMETTPLEFSSRDLMIKYTQNFIKKKYNYDVNKILRKSVLFNNIKTQMKLKNYFN